MTPAESITAATINAAYTLNRGDQIGSLEPGKLADFVIHDTDDYRDLAYFLELNIRGRFMSVAEARSHVLDSFL